MLVKTFSYLHDRRDPSLGRTLVETRVLVHGETGWHGSSYLYGDSTDDAQLAIARVDWNVVRQYDWLLELRTLRAVELHERKSGLLTAAYYHVNENFKIGAGYNFTDFSDDLTDLSYRSRGIFVNVLGKF